MDIEKIKSSFYSYVLVIIGLQIYISEDSKQVKLCNTKKLTYKNMVNFRIQILGLAELNDFKSIRLSALQKSPKMFGSSYTIEASKSLIFFEDCLRNSTVFGVFHQEKIIGLATLTRATSAKFSHKAHLTSVFIEPEFQRNGLASELLKFIIAFSKTHVEQILLVVANDNTIAIRLYEKFGFKSYGIEQSAMKFDNEYIDENLMKLIF